MVQGAVISPLSPNRVVENSELKVFAQQYDQGLAAIGEKREEN